MSLRGRSAWQSLCVPRWRLTMGIHWLAARSGSAAGRQEDDADDRVGERSEHCRGESHRCPRLPRAGRGRLCDGRLGEWEAVAVLAAPRVRGRLARSVLLGQHGLAEVEQAEPCLGGSRAHLGLAMLWASTVDWMCPVARTCTCAGWTPSACALSARMLSRAPAAICPAK